MSSGASSLKKKLSERTPFGVKLWVLIVTLSVAFIVSLMIIVSVCYIRHRRRKSHKSLLHLPKLIVSPHLSLPYRTPSSDRLLHSSEVVEAETGTGKVRDNGEVLSLQPSRVGSPNDQCGNMTDLESAGRYSPLVMFKDGWRWSKFSLKEIKAATNGFAIENVLGSGEYGVVYYGFLPNCTPVVVKKLVHSSRQDRDFIGEVGVIGPVKHKNLVKLLGYCIDGAHRFLICGYEDCGSLYQWLHGYPGQVSPLTWSNRTKVIQGIAKGLAYLHEDVEPQILHGCLNSRKILLDSQLNPKISDFGLYKLFDPHWVRRITESSGYEGPELSSPGAFTEKNDVYSFGVLVMEIISGRTPVDCHQSQPYLVDWMKSKVASQQAAEVLDPKMPEMPSLKELKRVLLIALRCVDSDINHRPKMGDVLHMLEPRDLLLTDANHLPREASRRFRERVSLNSGVLEGYENI